MKLIRLPSGQDVRVDDEDYERLTAHNWFFVRGYAARMRKSHEEYGPRAIYMHHEVIGRVEGLQVDHINGDKLDNQRANLRHCTRSQNAANMKHGRIKGVSFDKRSGKWRAYITQDYKRTSLGLFSTLPEAQAAYAAAARRLFGEHTNVSHS